MHSGNSQCVGLPSGAVIGMVCARPVIFQLALVEVRSHGAMQALLRLTGALMSTAQSTRFTCTNLADRCRKSSPCDIGRTAFSESRKSRGTERGRLACFYFVQICRVR